LNSEPAAKTRLLFHKLREQVEVAGDVVKQEISRFPEIKKNRAGSGARRYDPDEGLKFVAHIQAESGADAVLRGNGPEAGVVDPEGVVAPVRQVLGPDTGATKIKIYFNIVNGILDSEPIS
jgi:hypothetical protein